MVRVGKIRTALRTNQIVGFVAMPAWKKKLNKLYLYTVPNSYKICSSIEPRLALSNSYKPGESTVSTISSNTTYTTCTNTNTNTNTKTSQLLLTSIVKSIEV